MKQAFWTALPLGLGAILWGCSGPAPLDQAREAYEAGDYDRAIACSSTSIAEDGGPTDAYLIRGKAYEKKGEPLKAIGDYERVRQDLPSQGEAAFRQTRCYLTARRPVDADATITGVLKEQYSTYSPRDQMLAHAVQGEVRMSVGDYARATDSFGSALQVARSAPSLGGEPATGVVHYNLSRSQFELGAFRSSRDSFRSYLDIQKIGGNPPEPEDLYTLSVLHFLCEDIASARKLSEGLGAEQKAKLEAILGGDTFSVRALYELKQKQKERESGDGNP
jgi:tetratricopeptide (TPR) repeat protein